MQKLNQADNRDGSEVLATVEREMNAKFFALGQKITQEPKSGSVGTALKNVKVFALAILDKKSLERTRNDLVNQWKQGIVKQIIDTSMDLHRALRKAGKSQRMTFLDEKSMERIYTQLTTADDEIAEQALFELLTVRAEQVRSADAQDLLSFLKFAEELLTKQLADQQGMSSGIIYDNAEKIWGVQPAPHWKN